MSRRWSTGRSRTPARRGVSIQGLVQEISHLDVPPGKYDVVWLSSAMYSCVPARARRVAMVRRIAGALKPGGLFLCHYHRALGPQPTRMGLLARRVIAACTLGNLSYEPGDVLWGNIEFVHGFPSEDAVRSELEEGGFSVVCTQGDESTKWGGMVCKKTAEPGAGPGA